MMILNPLIDMVNGLIGVVNSVLEFMFGGIVKNINDVIPLLNGGITNLENTINSIFDLFSDEEEGDIEGEKDDFKIPRIPQEVPQFEPIEKFKPKMEEKKEEPTELRVWLVVDPSPTRDQHSMLLKRLVDILRVDRSL